MNGDILKEAHALINAERQDDYGDPTYNFSRTAELWSAYLDYDVKAKDVAICMALLKVAREAHRHKWDNLLDAIGYLALASDMEAPK